MKIVFLVTVNIRKEVIERVNKNRDKFYLDDTFAGCKIVEMKFKVEERLISQMNVVERDRVME